MCLSVILICMMAQAYIAVFSFLYGDAKRLIYGYDSFGNTCGQSQNSPIANMSLSGRNTSELPWVFLNVAFLLHLKFLNFVNLTEFEFNSNFD